MRGWGPQTFSRKSPQQHLTPQNTDKYVRTSDTGPKLGNKFFSEKKPERNLKNTKVSYACADVPDVCTYHFLLQIAFRDILTSCKFVHGLSEFSGAFHKFLKLSNYQVLVQKPGKTKKTLKFHMAARVYLVCAHTIVCYE